MFFKTMEIKYLTKLRDNPYAYPYDDFKYEIRSLSMTEIEALEQEYNAGQPFPIVLRELLFLAGASCYVLDYQYDTMQELQEAVNSRLVRYNRTISHPFFAIEVYGQIQCFYVHLDEGDDPAVWSGVYEGTAGTFPDWNFKIANSLSSYINDRIDRTKAGENVF